MGRRRDSGIEGERTAVLSRLEAFFFEYICMRGTVDSPSKAHVRPYRTRGNADPPMDQGRDSIVEDEPTSVVSRLRTLFSMCLHESETRGFK
jgi:hypothetical protein